MTTRFPMLIATAITAAAAMVGIASVHNDRSEPSVPQANVDASPFFSSDYASSRAKFLDAARAAGARVESYRHPLVGPTGEELYTDVAIVGSSEARNVLFVSSATHGVEGFAGSAIQVGLLLRGHGSRLAADTRLVLVHAVNPFGFAHLRRANEDNIDLNRNFRDHGQPSPANQAYDALADAIAPESISLLAEIGTLARLIFYAAGHGISAVRFAVTAGQYTHPQGLFYGGTAESWSAETLRTIVQKHGHGARKVAFVDVHTGLGPYGQGEIILNVPEEAPAYQRAWAWWGEMVKSTKADESVSEDLFGPLKLAIPTMLPGVEVTAVSLEIGTVSSLAALRALRAENWLHHYGGDRHPEAVRIKTELLRAFYPDASDWRAAVWRQGEHVVDRALKGLSG